MFLLKEIKDVPVKPEPCVIGLPEHPVNDICIINTGNPYAAIQCNKDVLVQALLTDPAYTMFLLGIKVTKVGK